MSLSREFLLATSVFVLASGASAAGAADAPAFYQLQSVLNLGGTGTSWDHIDYDQSRHLAYLSRRADGLTVVDVAKLDRGYTANTDGATSIFKLSDFSAVDRISFGDNFDGVVYDEATNILAYQQADNSKELLVDAGTMKLVAAIEVHGTQLERPIIDDKSDLYLPLRDTHVVYKIDLRTKEVVAKWDVSPKCTQPSGAEFDLANHRLLLPCRGMITTPVLAVINADNGHSDCNVSYWARCG